jgi:hypothetical protein
MKVLLLTLSLFASAHSPDVPLDKPYKELSAEQQQAVKFFYGPMAAGDEPPYPLRGLLPISRTLGEIPRQNVGTDAGDVSLLVQVGADGKARQVSIIESANVEFGRLAAIVLLKTEFKPALCKGAPCDMDYRYITSYDAKRSGFGYLYYASGAQYVGPMLEGQPEGLGKWTSVIGDEYLGQWKNGKRHGEGKLTYILGGGYEGEWSEGSFHGKGVLTYAGSGRRHEVQFEYGFEQGAAVNDSTVQKVASYRLLADGDKRESRKLLNGASFPLDKPYGVMTADEKSGVHAPYGVALAGGDEPPFPVDGMRQIGTTISQENDRQPTPGLVRLIVQVEASGKPSGVTIYKSPSEKMGKFITKLFMQQQFKPAVCDGVACAMPYFYEIGLR